MRKHFIDQGFVALEASQLAHQKAMENISMEEEIVMLDEASQDQASVASDLAETDRILEVSDSLEDLAVIADGIEEATPAEIALIENAGDMAVAGTDVSPEEVIPAMESYVGRRISTEGIKEKAKQIWESIIRFLKSIWEKIEGFVYKTVGTIPRLRKSIEALEVKIEALGSAKAGKEIEIKSGVTSLSVAGEPIKSAAELATALGHTGAAAKFVFGPYLESVVSRGEKTATAIGDFDVTQPEDSAKALVSALNSVKMPSMPGLKATAKNHIVGFQTATGNHQLGNVHLLAKAYNDKDDGSVLAVLNRQRRSGIELTASDTPVKADATIKMAPLTAAAMTSVLKTSKEILKTLEEFERGARKTAVKKAQADISSAADKATKSMDSKAEGANEAVAVAYYRALVNFGPAYARWVQSPALAQMSTAMTAVRATCMVVQKSLSTYEAPAA